MEYSILVKKVQIDFFHPPTPSRGAMFSAARGGFQSRHPPAPPRRGATGALRPLEPPPKDRWWMGFGRCFLTTVRGWMRLPLNQLRLIGGCGRCPSAHDRGQVDPVRQRGPAQRQAVGAAEALVAAELDVVGLPGAGDDAQLRLAGAAAVIVAANQG